MICPVSLVVDRPELRQVWWQDAGRYAVRWVWERDATSWRCDYIGLRERLEEAMAGLRAPDLTPEDIAHAQQLARDFGW